MKLAQLCGRHRLAVSGTFILCCVLAIWLWKREKTVIPPRASPASAETKQDPGYEIPRGNPVITVTSVAQPPSTNQPTNAGESSEEPQDTQPLPESRERERKEAREIDALALAPPGFKKLQEEIAGRKDTPAPRHDASRAAFLKERAALCAEMDGIAAGFQDMTAAERQAAISAWEETHAARLQAHRQEAAIHREWSVESYSPPGAAASGLTAPSTATSQPTNR